MSKRALSRYLGIFVISIKCFVVAFNQSYSPVTHLRPFFRFPEIPSYSLLAFLTYFTFFHFHLVPQPAPYFILFEDSVQHGTQRCYPSSFFDLSLFIGRYSQTKPETDFVTVAIIFSLIAFVRFEITFAFEMNIFGERFRR